MLDVARLPAVRAVILQRLAMLAMDAKDLEEAEQFLVDARRADPNQEDLPLTELAILAHTGSEAELKSRAHWWLKRLEKRGDQDHPYWAHLEAVAKRGRAAMMIDGLEPKGEQNLANPDSERPLIQLAHLLVEHEQEFTDQVTLLKNGNYSLKAHRSLHKPAIGLVNEIYQLEDFGPDRTLRFSDQFSTIPNGDLLLLGEQTDWIFTLINRPGLLGNATVLWAVYQLLMELHDLNEADVAEAMLMSVIPRLHVYLLTLFEQIPEGSLLKRGSSHYYAIGLMARKSWTYSAKLKNET
ncbi:MAG: hypothetical protein WEB07_01760 [Natronospirillum sp.]